MRESCSCGAAIHTISYRRAVEWRFTHQHLVTETLSELTSDTKVIPVGFTPNDAEEE